MKCRDCIHAFNIEYNVSHSHCHNNCRVQGSIMDTDTEDFVKVYPYEYSLCKYTLKGVKYNKVIDVNKMMLDGGAM